MTSVHFKCPQDLLEDDETIERLGAILDDLPRSPEQWWDRATHALHYEAIEYKHQHRLPVGYNVLGLILCLSKHRVCP